MNYLKGLVAIVPVDRIGEVMLRAVRYGIEEFHVLDDRGGNGGWQVVFVRRDGVNPTRKYIRQLVGPDIDVQEN